jgi:hypothetical protein
MLVHEQNMFGENAYTGLSKDFGGDIADVDLVIIDGLNFSILTSQASGPQGPFCRQGCTSYVLVSICMERRGRRLKNAVKGIQASQTHITHYK